MIVRRAVVRKFGELIAEAERRTIERIQDGAIETEPSATDRFIADVERAFEESGEKGEMRFRVRTLRDRGPSAPEKKYGADICGVLDVKMRKFSQTKGFLSQAKSEGRGVSVQTIYRGLAPVGFSDRSELRRLADQLDNMLSITPDSFVFVYSTKGFVVVPASSVRGLQASGTVYGKPVARFFKEYLMCFVGDTRLKAYDDASLHVLRRESNARTAILFQIAERDLTRDFRS